MGRLVKVKPKAVRGQLVKCVICRGEADTLNSTDLRRKNSCAAVSFCSIFGIPANHPFKILFESAHYCTECVAEIQEADVTLGKLEILKQSLLRFQDRIYSKLGDNYFQIDNIDNLEASYKEFEIGGDSVRGKKFSYDEIVKIIYEKLDQDCSKWERFSSDVEGFQSKETNVAKLDAGIQTDPAELFSGSAVLPDQHKDWPEPASWNDEDQADYINEDLLKVTPTSEEELKHIETTPCPPPVPHMPFTQPPTNFDKTINCTYDPENCKRFFYDEYNLKVHIRSFHEGNPKPHECTVCKKTFTEEGRLKTHYFRVHAPIDKATLCICEHCGKSLSTPAVLKDHVRKIHERKCNKNFCCFCGAGFLTKKGLQEHEDIHRSKKSPFDCIFCDEPQPNSSVAKEHYMANHSDAKYRCKECSKVLATKASLRLHMMLHTDTFKCDVCPYSASSRTGLIAHKQSHSSEKPHTCHICGTAYKYNKNLTAHMRSHSGEKPYYCNVCGRTFREHSYLKRHEESHSSESLYACNEESCEKKFKTKENLRKHHKAVHLGIKKRRMCRPRPVKANKSKEQKLRATGDSSGPSTQRGKRKTKRTAVKTEHNVEKVNAPSLKAKRKKLTKKLEMEGESEPPPKKTKPKSPTKVKNSVSPQKTVTVTIVNKEKEQLVPKSQPSYSVVGGAITEEQLTAAVTSIEMGHTEQIEIPVTSIFPNATVVYADQYAIQQSTNSTTFELVPISTPVTVVSSRDVTYVNTRSSTTPERPSGSQRYSVQYKYTP